MPLLGAQSSKKEGRTSALPRSVRVNWQICCNRLNLFMLISFVKAQQHKKSLFTTPLSLAKINYATAI
jgi:hypothetical protein